MMYYANLVPAIRIDEPPTPEKRISASIIYCKAQNKDRFPLTPWGADDVSLGSATYNIGSCCSVLLFFYLFVCFYYAS